MFREERVLTLMSNMSRSVFRIDERFRRVSEDHRTRKTTTSFPSHTEVANTLYYTLVES